jgi:hypothetical protein
MNSENLFAKKVIRHLESAATQVDNANLHRLRQSRERAMNAYREPQRILGLITVGAPFIQAFDRVRERPLAWLAPLALLIGLGWYGLANDNSAELGELDAAILSSDVPLNALVDRDFNNLLKPES